MHRRNVPQHPAETVKAELVAQARFPSRSQAWRLPGVGWLVHTPRPDLVVVDEELVGRARFPLPSSWRPFHGVTPDLAHAISDDIVFSGPGATVQTRVTIPFNAQFFLDVDRFVGFSHGLVVNGSAVADLTLSASMFCGNSCGFNTTLNVRWDALDPFGPRVTASPGIVFSLDFLEEIVLLETHGEILGDTYFGADVSRTSFFHGYFDSGRTTVPVGVRIAMNSSIASGVGTYYGLSDWGSRIRPAVRFYRQCALDRARQQRDSW